MGRLVDVAELVDADQLLERLAAAGAGPAVLDQLPDPVLEAGGVRLWCWSDVAGRAGLIGADELTVDQALVDLVAWQTARARAATELCPGCALTRIPVDDPAGLCAECLADRERPKAVAVETELARKRTWWEANGRAWKAHNRTHKAGPVDGCVYCARHALSG